MAIAKSEAALTAFDRDEIDGCAGRAPDLRIGPRRLAFTAESPARGARAR